MIPFPATVRLSEIVEHSFKDYHARGVHYLCLSRTPKLTTKLYLFDEGIKPTALVFPHDHRYHFQTWVIAGEVGNVWYYESPHPTLAKAFDPYHRFRWATVLKGGKGFSYDGETQLAEANYTTYGQFSTYMMKPEEIHTLKILRPETALLILQGPSISTKPTRTFCFDKEPPSLDGLYSKFGADEIIAHLRRFRDATQTQFKLVK